MTLDDRLEQRRRERHGSATLRAVGQRVDAEYRHQQLVVDGETWTFGVPYLLVDLAMASDAVARGIVDGLAVRLRYQDAEAYRKHQPSDPFERVVYDLAEQFRCEAQVAASLPGVDQNIERAFLSWCRSDDGTMFLSTAVGTLLYTVMHMMRSRVVRQLSDEQIETQIEETRSRVSPAIGGPLRMLRQTANDADTYLGHAAELAAAIGAFAAVGDDPQGAGAQDVLALFVPTDWQQEDLDDSGSLPFPSFGGVDDEQPVGPDDLDHVGGYAVFTTTYDQELTGAALYPSERRRRLRAELDLLRSAQAVSVGRLAQQLQRRLAHFGHDGWTSAVEDGVLDAARLTQLIADPTNHRIFRTERIQPTAPLCVTFLMDNSGSMKRQRYESLAVLVDTMARALDLAGATSEVLGFSTGAWNGGRAMRDWRTAGEPANPGRLAEALHVVYKDADTPWRRARTSIASLLATQHYREGIDGEALAWAYRRLRLRPEPHRVLVLLSDGAPMDAATLNANGELFLPTHLRRVARSIERDATVRVRGLSVDVAVDAIFSTESILDLDGALSLATYGSLIDLLV